MFCRFANALYKWAVTKTNSCVYFNEWMKIYIWRVKNLHTKPCLFTAPASNVKMLMSLANRYPCTLYIIMYITLMSVTFPESIKLLSERVPTSNDYNIITSLGISITPLETEECALRKSVFSAFRWYKHATVLCDSFPCGRSHTLLLLIAFTPCCSPL